MPFIQDQNELRDDYKIRKRVSPGLVVLRSRSTQGIILLAAIAIVVPTLVYYFLLNEEPIQPNDTCAIAKGYRIQCGSDNANFTYCSSIYCCFDNSTKTCFHYLPSKYYYLKSGAAFEKSLDKSPFGKDQSKNVQISVSEIDKNTVKFILHDGDVKSTVDVSTTPDKNYNYNLTENGTLNVYRDDDQTDLLLTTAKGPLIISENYWEWSFQLTEQYLFGLGETLIKLEEGSNLTKVIYCNEKDHSTLPVFLAYKNIEDVVKYHGLVVRHQGPLEVTVLSSNLVSLKSLTGRKIELELNVGPTIQEVMAQQNRDKDGTNDTVDMYLLGIHLCRGGSSTSLSNILSDFESEISSTVYDISYASDCLHENLVMSLMTNPKADVGKLQAAISNITHRGQRFVLAIPPQVPVKSSLYSNATDLNVFFKNKTEDYKGKYLKMAVVYPDFNHLNISSFVGLLSDQLKENFSNVWPSDFILSHNWPADDSFKMEATSDFQYLSKALIDSMSSTLPWNVTSSGDRQYLDHNNYGASQLQKLMDVIKGNFMTASHTFDTIQPVMVQNLDISWTNFRKSIVTILSNSFSGHPWTSIPVCGSTSTFNSSYESLCIRWYMMAATAPIFRISSDTTAKRDPNSLAQTSKYASDKAMEAIEFRNSLKYYFNTILRRNEPLMRPMFYDFPEDQDTFGLVEQYMVGPSLLVAHPTLPDQSQIRIYLPKKFSTWFEFQGGANYTYSNKTNGSIVLPIVETDRIGFMPEGAIIPLVEVQEKVTLKVALNCVDTDDCTAVGDLESYSFTFNSTEVTIQSNVTGTIDFVLIEVIVFKAEKTPRYCKAASLYNLSKITSCSYSDESSCTLSCT